MRSSCQQPVAVPAAVWASWLVYLFKPILWEQGFPDGSVGKEFSCSAGDEGLIPGSGRSPGGGNGYPLQYSCLGNPMDRGAWWATVHRAAKNQTWSSYWTQSTCGDSPFQWSRTLVNRPHCQGLNTYGWELLVEGSTPISGRTRGQSPHSSDGTDSSPYTMIRLRYISEADKMLVFVTLIQWHLQSWWDHREDKCQSKCLHWGCTSQSVTWSHVSNICPKRTYTKAEEYWSISHRISKAPRPRCPLTDEQINRMWAVHTMDYCTTLTRKEILTQAATWLNPGDIMLGEIASPGGRRWGHSSRPGVCWPATGWGRGLGQEESPSQILTWMHSGWLEGPFT